MARTTVKSSSRRAPKKPLVTFKQLRAFNPATARGELLLNSLRSLDESQKLMNKALSESPINQRLAAEAITLRNDAANALDNFTEEEIEAGKRLFTSFSK